MYVAEWESVEVMLGIALDVDLATLMHTPSNFFRRDQPESINVATLSSRSAKMVSSRSAFDETKCRL